jgi:hypothetical protein
MQAHIVAILPSNPENMTMNGLLAPYPDVNRSTDPNLPADPENMNDLRAQQADSILVSFAREHGEDDDINLDTLRDMLRRMGHWCDRNSYQWADAVRMAAADYSDETNGQGRQFSA